MYSSRCVYQLLKYIIISQHNYLLSIILLQRHVSTQPSRLQAKLEPYLRCMKWRCTFGIPKVYNNRY